MKSLLLVALLIVTYPLFAEEKNYGDVIVSKVESVHDGDTITVTINKWPTITGERIPVRIDGVDTPEINGDCPLYSRDKWRLSFRERISTKSKTVYNHFLTNG